MRRSSEKWSGSARLATSAKVGGATPRLRDVEDLERAARGGARRLVAQRPAEHAVELARRDAPVPVLGHLRGRLEDARDAPAASCADVRSTGAWRANGICDASAAWKSSAVPRLAVAPPRPTCWPTRMSPRPASTAYDGDARVLARRPLARVHDEQRHVALLDALPRLDDREDLGPLLGLAAAPDPGRVHEPEAPARGLDARVDRVARGARDLRHDRAVLAEQRVDERGLPDVRAARRSRGRSRGRARRSRRGTPPLPPELVSRSAITVCRSSMPMSCSAETP